MREFKIYTAGKMSGLSFQEQMSWRNEIEDCVRNQCERYMIPESKVKFIHPPLYYRYDKKYHKSEKEVKDWELGQIRDSDIVIVNLDGIESSIGTHYELSTVDAMNSFGDKHIFIIGVGNPIVSLHPWIAESLHRHEEYFEDAADYVVNYLLV